MTNPVRLFQTLLLALVFSLLPSFTMASSSSPIAYDIILAVVILELIFAFSVGLVCIIFSFNLIVALKDTSNEVIDTLPEGDLPPSRISLHQRGSSFDVNNGNNNRDTFDESSGGNSRAVGGGGSAGYSDYKTFHNVARTPTNRASFASEMDVETGVLQNNNNNSFKELFNTFYNYIRLW
jgi:hypothetical protein